jgi:hypothetical protein
MKEAFLKMDLDGRFCTRGLDIREDREDKLISCSFKPNLKRYLMKKYLAKVRYYQKKEAVVAMASSKGA